MNQQNRPDANDFGNFVHSLWRHRWLVLATTLVGTSAALAHAILAVEFFRSEALVQPREEVGLRGALGTMTSQFAGLSQFTGLQFGISAERSVVLATLRSRAVIEPFIEENRLLPKLYEGSWDSETQKWKVAEKYVPTTWQAYNDFFGILSISDDKKTGLITIAVEWKDPREAQQWVTEIIARANKHLRAKAIEEGQRNLAYLEAQSRSIGQVELQRALYSLVEAELKKLMIAKGGEEFAFKTIDPAVVPKKRIRPKRRLIVVLGFALGGFAGITFVLLRMSWSVNKG